MPAIGMLLGVDQSTPQRSERGHRLALALPLAVIFVLSGAAFALLTLAPERIFAWDGLYHIKFAYLLRTESIVSTLRWLPFTIGGELGVDHHWLFHVLLIPFTFGDLVLGLKWAMIIYGALAVTIFYWVLRQMRVPWPTIFTLLLVATGAPFILRLLMGRAGTIALPLMLLFVLFLRESRWLALCATTYILTLAYGITVILGPLVVIALGAQLAVERRVEWRALLYTAFGILLGLVANPYFPNNFEFMLFITLFKFSASTGSTRIGAEWAPYDTWNALSLFWPLWLAISGSLIHSLARRIRWSLDSWTLFAMFVFFLVFFLRHSRFFEYAVPFGAFFCGLYWRDALAPPLSTGSVEGSSSMRPPIGLSPAIDRRIVAALFVVGIALGAQRLVAAREGIDRFGANPDAMKDEALWLERHTPKDAIVFNLRYDTFPYLFLHNHHNRYVTGLEPLWMRYTSPKRFEIYNAMVWSGRYKGNYVETLAKEFRSRFVVGPRSKALFKHFRKKGFKTRLIGRGGFVLEAPN
ncbi:MAG: hypothetical protein KC609_05685 [Myxococcales bacterium]|nr:hypothetical protein [Myxococcales bacterium]